MPYGPQIWKSMTSDEHLQAAANLIGAGRTHDEQLAATLLATLHTNTAIALRLPSETTTRTQP